MSISNKNLRDVAQIAADIMEGKIKHPNQQKLDVHEPEKDELTAKDFEMLRAKKDIAASRLEQQSKKKMKEETEEVAEETIEEGTPAKNTDVADKSYLKNMGKKPTVKSDLKNLGRFITGKKETNEDVDAAAETILEYESKDGKFVHRARPGAYGGTKDEKHAVDTLSGPKTKELKAIESEKKKKMSEMVATYKEQGLKGLFEALKKEEVIVEEPTSAEFDAQLADAKQRAAGTKKQPEISKPAVQAVQNEETHTKVEFIDYNDVNGVKISEIDLEERSLTEPEMKKKEEIVKSMKKGISGFKERYGKDAKSVMYATATARAKGE
jgi:hypothetical protein